MDPQSRSLFERYFEPARLRLERLFSRFSDQPKPLLEACAEHFAALLPQLGYRDRPDHVLAPALYVCAINLAAYLALRPRGIDAHAFGGALLQGLARAPLPPPTAVADPEQAQKRWAEFEAAAASSQSDPRPGEDVFEAVAEQGSLLWGYTIHACAVCHLFAAHDAAELVPYMCAVDDLTSARTGQVLQRSGSIALGASHCDFRYYKDGAPTALADQFPDQIQFTV